MKKIKFFVLALLLVLLFSASKSNVFGLEPGECESCILDTGTNCPQGQYTTVCMTTQNQVSNKCCRPNANTPTPTSEVGNADVNFRNVNVKCNCTTQFSACGNKWGKTNIEWRSCTPNMAGTKTCTIATGTVQNPTFWEVQTCTSNPTATPGGPTPTPGGPTPTVNPQCVCAAAGTSAGSCSPQCDFNKQTGITTYNNPFTMKCTVAATFFQTAPIAANKNDWCRRPERTKGDANGDDKVTLMDYFYYVSAKFGGKIPSSINPDFNGDGAINAEDRAIIIKSL